MIRFNEQRDIDEYLNFKRHEVKTSNENVFVIGFDNFTDEVMNPQATTKKKEKKIVRKMNYIAGYEICLLMEAN